jgi:hypothetical protein
VVKAQEGEFLASIVEQTQVKPERESFRAKDSSRGGESTT